MQHDEAIWEVIGKKFCSFKVCPPGTKQEFCKNEFNLTGLCSRRSCPLANSNYATVLEKEGVLYLYIKVIERAHSPKNLWERVMLPRNYAQALALIDSKLAYWNSFVVHKCKQRLTKIHQYLLQMRKLRLKVQPKMVPIKKKIERRDAVREVKAFKAAKVSEAIKAELLNRLQAGTYGDIYNFPQQEFEQVLEDQEEQEMEAEPEFVEELDEEVYSDQDEDGSLEDFDVGSFGSQDAQDDWEILRSKVAADKSKKKGPRVEIEYEQEPEATTSQLN
jgi:protein MAK16